MTGSDKKIWQPASQLTLKKIALPLVEIAFGCYMFVCLFMSVVFWFGIGSAPFLAIFSCGYFYVGFSSLYALYKMSREPQGFPLEAAEIEPVEQLSA